MIGHYAAFRHAASLMLSRRWLPDAADYSAAFAADYACRFCRMIC